MTVKNKTQKIISSLLIISIILPSVILSNTKKAEAAIPVIDSALISAISPPTWLSKSLHAIGVPSTVMNTGLHIKDFAEFLLRQTLMLVAKTFLAKMTQATINWINSDFHGAPLFLENPESFFKDIAKSQIRNLVDMIGYDTFRFPFGRETALNVISSYKRQLEDNAQYTLSKVINDPDLLVRYRNDFNYGGWNGFLINTQYPQNNYLGFNIIIQQNLASRLQGTLVAPAQKIQNLLQQGMGFLSPQECPTNPAYNNGVNEFLRPSFKSNAKYNFTAPTPVPYNEDASEEPSAAWLAQNAQIEQQQKAYTAKFDSDQVAEKAKWAQTNVCPGGLVSTTPGSVAANQIMTAMSSSYRQSELAAALGNSLSAIFDALINHFLDKGLNALSSTVSPRPSDDNWSYDGNSFSGGTTPATPGVSALRIPQNVSATVGQVTSTMISGGTAPYVIIEQYKPNPSVAIAKISAFGPSGPTLTVTGVAPGQTLLTVRDSSDPIQTVRVDISINAVGALAVTPHDISTGINKPITATIAGGKEPYNIRTGPNESVAVVAFAGANLVVTGIERGNTFIVIEDSSFPVQKTTTVQITINGPEDLIIPQNITVNVGQAISIPISGGISPYIIIDQQDGRIATGQIFNPIQATLRITGITVGETAIVIKDSSNLIKITSVNITVIDDRTLIVTPQNVSANIDQITSMTISGGTPNYSIDTPPDTRVATAQILGSNIIITGKATGQTSMIVRDSSTPPKTINVPITIGALIVTPQNVSTSVGQTTNVTISGGVAPYSIDTAPDATMVNAQINLQNNFGSNTNTITITGRAKGQTGMIIKDSSVPTKTTGIQITIN
ncbi:hypothetical protein EXS45_01980 [Candidatus Nomurabacteria bacterium]|nr:hypothetical protein [Candidatus Nomurabacteria bacterium]